MSRHFMTPRGAVAVAFVAILVFSVSLACHAILAGGTTSMSGAGERACVGICPMSTHVEVDALLPAITRSGSPAAPALLVVLASFSAVIMPLVMATILRSRLRFRFWSWAASLPQHAANGDFSRYFSAARDA